MLLGVEFKCLKFLVISFIYRLLGGHMSDTAQLNLGEKTIELPIVTGSEGERAIDITKLRSQTGFITIDNGYMNTGSCTSDITFLNGEKGILRYRGYKIEDLAEHSNFIETSYLLVNGVLPTKRQLDFFNEKIVSFATLPKGITNMLDTFPRDAHPMGVLSSGIAALSAYYPDFLDHDLSDSEKDRAVAQLMAQVKVMMAYFYRRAKGEDPVRSHPSLGYCADFMNMIQYKPGYEVDHEVAKALNVLLILHADHEQNCSASTVRMVGSSNANIFATISAGVDALWGPLHGGANQAVIEMLETIKKNGGDYKKFIKKAKDKNDSFKLMGFGHRVYKNFDPRANIIKKACDTVLSKLGVQDPMLDIAKGLEEEARSDSYFVERNLYPNVDFYSGIIYRALGIPTNMFTAMFVLGRLPGWLAQWKEQVGSPTAKICRPRQIYTGPTVRDYVKVEERK